MECSTLISLIAVARVIINQPMTHIPEQLSELSLPVSDDVAISSSNIVVAGIISKAFICRRYADNETLSLQCGQ